jgi:hypothetical protein
LYRFDSAASTAVQLEYLFSNSILGENKTKENRKIRSASSSPEKEKKREKITWVYSIICVCVRDIPAGESALGNVMNS